MENYEPDPSDAVSAVAEASGREAAEVAYDMMCHSKDGSSALGCLWRPVFANRPDGTYNPSLDDVHNRFMNNEHAVPGVADAGAHGTMLTDAVSNTTLLAHYVRDREAQMPIEMAVYKSCLAAAEIYGLTDRGVLAPGMKADSKLSHSPSFVSSSKPQKSVHSQRLPAGQPEGLPAGLRQRLAAGCAAVDPGGRGLRVHHGRGCKLSRYRCHLGCIFLKMPAISLRTGASRRSSSCAMGRC